MQTLERNELIRRTHDILCGIAGKNIELIYGAPPGATDCESFITVPLEDPHADLIHKHEWQHVLFHSDLAARELFVDSFAEHILKKLKVDEQGLKNFLHLFVNAVDDLRVCSLWARTYAQSGGDIQDRWQRILMQSKRYKDCFIRFTMAIGLKLRGSLEPTAWDEYADVVSAAVEATEGASFAYLLLVCRLLLEQVIGRVMENSRASTPEVLVGNRLLTPPARTTQVAQRLLNKLIRAAQCPDLAADAKCTKTVSRPSQVEAVVHAALGMLEGTALTALLTSSQVEIEQVISTLNGVNKHRTIDQALLGDLTSFVSFKDIAKEDVDLQKLYKGDHEMIEGLRHNFLRLMGKKRRSLSDVGLNLNTSAYVESLTHVDAQDIFEEDISSKGCSVLVLLDMSNSMMPAWPLVSRACKDLALGLDVLPFIDLTVWGFTSDAEGRVTLYRFKEPHRGYTGAALEDAWGMTPLHHAVQVASRHLVNSMPGPIRQLFILSDGYPTAPGLPHMGSDDLMDEVSKDVRAARRKGIRVSTLIVGKDISNSDATHMFGKAAWQRTKDDEDLFEALIALVNGAIREHLLNKYA